MASQTYIAFDYGISRIGVAVGQTITHSATALPILNAQNGRLSSTRLDQLVEDWQPSGFVLGIPAEPQHQTHINIAKRVGSFAAYLKRRYDKPCFFIDERLSSRVLRDQGYKGHIDSLVAQALLNDWLACTSSKNRIDRVQQAVADD